MIRSAAKNFKDVAVVSNPSDYSRLIEEWKEEDGISYEFRKELSQKVFTLMADYNLLFQIILEGETQSIYLDYTFETKLP